MAFKEPPMQEKVNGENLESKQKKDTEHSTGERLSVKEGSENQDTIHDKDAEKPPILDSVEPILEPIIQEVENWEHDSKMVELVGLGTWITALSSFIVINNFVGPWPDFMSAVPRGAWGLTHAISGMLFGGGIILTTAFEWLVTNNKNRAVLSFYFDKVPFLDSIVVLPALTAAIISGVGLSIAKYDGLGLAPPHIQYVLWCLTAFASWWAITDLSTQGSALKAISEWDSNTSKEQSIPKVIEFRKFSNIVSCGFVMALYYLMVMKPGYDG